MLVQEIFSAVALAYLLGLGYLANYLNHHISVKVLLEEHEVRICNFAFCGRLAKVNSRFLIQTRSSLVDLTSTSKF